MYTSIRRYRMDPAKVADLTRRVESGFVPLVSQVAGFVGYYVVDGGSGVVASISVFEDRKGAEESNKKAADWVRRELTELIREAPEITAGEVIVSHEK